MSASLQVGDPAPDFELATDGGGSVRLSDLQGGPAVVYFYPKDDTSGCTKEAIAFSEHKPAFDAIGARIIGISADSVEDHDAFVCKHNLSITLGSDENREVIDKYGVWVEKSMYGRKFMGIERATFLVGRDGRIQRIWRKVSVPGHAEEVLEAASIL